MFLTPPLHSPDIFVPLPVRNAVLPAALKFRENTASVGIEPTTSGLDLPLLFRLSYEVAQRKSGTIKVVNRGEERVRVHINVSLSTLILCSTICVHSTTRPRSLVGRATVDIIRMSWVRFPPRT